MTDRTADPTGENEVAGHSLKVGRAIPQDQQGEGNAALDGESEPSDEPEIETSAAEPDVEGHGTVNRKIGR